MRFNIEYIQKNSTSLFHRFRWNAGKDFKCPHCGSTRISKGIKQHHCNSCNHSFSDTSNTIFHSTKLPLWKWLVSIYYFLESPRGISSYTLAKYVSISQPTAWRILHLLRSNIGTTIQATKDVILDEAYLGCDWHFKQAYKKYEIVKNLETRMRLENPRWVMPINKATWKRLNYQAASLDKMIVLGIRDYKARKLELIHMPTINQESVLNLVKMRDSGIEHIITDQSPLYNKLPYNRSICNHKESKYKSGDGYTSNPIENHFTHLKRMWHGIYQWFSDKYCQGYLDEFAFRYNHRKMRLEDRFQSLFCLIITNVLPS